MKKLLVPVIALGVLGVGLFTTQYAQAADTDNPQTTIVEKIAQKFGLKQDEVQAVFDEVHKEHQDQARQNQTERLTQAVADGKITEAQKKLILEKQEEFHTKMESRRGEMKNKTPGEMKEEMEQTREELEAWAEENGIDTEYIMGGHGPKMMFKRF